MVKEPELKVIRFEPTRPFLPRPVNVATPETAATVVEPVRLPELIATVTSSVALVTVLPETSWIVTAGDVVKSVRFTKPEA